jgi:hypothetical protein
MADSDDLFSHINRAILDLQASGLQNFHRPIKRLAQLLYHQDLRAVNEQLTAIVDVDAFLQVSYQTGGSMVGSQKLLWPDNIKEQLGLSLCMLFLFVSSRMPNHAWPVSGSSFLM